MQDFQTIINKLQELSPYQLYRLSIWIDNEINRPQKIQEMRNKFKIRDRLQWFDRQDNNCKNCIVLKKNRTQVFIQSEDSARWNIPYYFLNLENIQTILPISHTKLTKNDFSVGEDVEFNHDGNQYVGKIVRLNTKTAPIRVAEHSGLWRVTYHCLSKLIDSKVNYIAGELV